MEKSLNETNLDIKNILTPDYAARFAYHSFRHSQGNQWLQKQIVSYAHAIRPSWEVQQSDIPKISTALNTLLPSFEKMKQQGLHVSTEATSYYGTSRATDRILGLMEHCLKGESEPKESELKGEIINDISKAIINQDHHFLIQKYGRNKIPPDINSPSRDDWLSHVVHFGLNGKPTGLKEFDEMYRDVRAHILSGRLDQESQKKFDEVLQIYKDKHSGVAINMQP